nr:unnamed protein product [Callosobruchus chinensis]
MSEITFRTKAVRKVMQSLDINKTTGPNMIPAVVAKKCAPELAPILTRLFRMSYISGVFPKDWKSACIQPVPKKGSKADSFNYRPIALLSVISKVMEKCVNQELMKYLELRQYGFQQQRSTGDLLAYVTHVWNKLIHSFADFLSGRKITVVVDGFSSSFHNINAGVPQGSVLAPKLFLLLINDLLSSTTKPIHSFADDSTLHAGIMSNRPISVVELERRRLATAASLSNDLEAITAWGLKNMVEFNESKTQYCTLSNKDPVLYAIKQRPSISQEVLLTIQPSHAIQSPDKSLPGVLLTHIWGAAAPTTLSILDAVQRRAIRLIEVTEITFSKHRQQADRQTFTPTEMSDIELRDVDTIRHPKTYCLKIQKIRSYNDPGTYCVGSKKLKNLRFGIELKVPIK